MKRTIVIRAVTSAALLFILFYFIGFERVADSLSHVIFSLFLFALLIENAGVMVSAKRWQIILEENNIELCYKEALALYYMGSFFNTVMPSSFGGDVIKAYKLGKRTDTIHSFSSVILDRISGLVGVVIIATLSMIAFHSYLPTDVLLFSLFIILSFLSLFMLVLKTKIFEKINRFLFSRWSKIFNFFNGVINTIKDFKSRKLWLSIISISILYHLMLVINNYILALSLNIKIDFFYFLIFVPVSQILVALPVSIQGFGVREGSYALLFPAAGVAAASAFSLGFLNQIVKVITSIIGGVVYVIKK